MSPHDHAHDKAKPVKNAPYIEIALFILFIAISGLAYHFKLHDGKTASNIRALVSGDNAPPDSALEKSDTVPYNLDTPKATDDLDDAETEAFHDECEIDLEAMIFSAVSNQSRATISQYRQFLWNFQEMTTKFRADLPYDVQLDYLLRYNLPDALQELVEKFRLYNETHAHKTRCELVVIKPAYLGRFIKIRKCHGDTKFLSALKNEIKASMRHLNTYLYSDTLQEWFFSQ